MLHIPSSGSVTDANKILYRAFQMGFYDFGSDVFAPSNAANPVSAFYSSATTNGANSFIVRRSVQPIDSGGCWLFRAMMPKAASYPDDWRISFATVTNEETGSEIPMELVSHESSHDSDTPGSVKMNGFVSGTYELFFYMSHHDEGGPNVPSAYQAGKWA